MTISRIQRRAFLIALATMLGAAALILCYWQAVANGMLPSPVQSIARRPAEALTTTVTSRQVAVAAATPVSARPLATNPKLPATKDAPVASASAKPEARTADPATPVPNDPTAETRKPATRPTAPRPVEPAAQSALTDRPSGPASSNRVNFAAKDRRGGHSEPPTTSTPPPPVSDPEDQKMASQWLASTNGRPVVRVHFDPDDILRLAASGRGLIVATGGGETPEREVYLHSRPNEAVLFVPYTASVAARFSSYSLTLDSSAAAFSRYSATLAAYFPEGASQLAFVPDQALATTIFAAVAKASRSLDTAAQSRTRLIFEGELTVEGANLSFTVTELRSGSS